MTSTERKWWHPDWAFVALMTANYSIVKYEALPDYVYWLVAGFSIIGGLIGRHSAK